MIETLKGVRVVDLTAFEDAGSAYSKLLAEYGAETILIETVKAEAGRNSHEFDFYHAFKESLALDLESADGRQILYELLKTADVFITSFSEQKLKRLGLHYEAISAMNPGIIYARGTIYGEEGHLRDEPANASAVWWASSGHMWGSMELGDVPPIPNSGLPEVNVGKSLTLGICAALFRRARTGKGMYLSTSVLGEAIYDNADTPLEVQYGAEYPKTRKRPRRATLNTYHCKDGWIAIITLSFEKDFGNLMEAIGRPDLRGDPRWTKLEDTMYDNSPEVVAIMDEALAKLSCDEAVSRIKAFDMAAIKIAAVDDVLRDPQILANKYLFSFTGSDGKKVVLPQSPVRFGDYEPAEYRRAPEHGENTRTILRALGYGQEAVEALIAAGTVAAT